MKKLLLMSLLLSVLLTGCDEREHKDLYVTCNDYYVNVTEEWVVGTYNGYRCTSYSVDDSKDGTYVVTFTFSNDMVPGRYKKGGVE